MTDQDNLRSRIASVVAERNAYFGGHTGRADPKAVAQAIIDELGLTNEWSFRFEGKDRRYSLNRAEDIRTIGLYGPLEDAAIESRIVGKWEVER